MSLNPSFRITLPFKPCEPRDSKFLPYLLDYFFLGFIFEIVPMRREQITDFLAKSETGTVTPKDLQHVDE
jgi:hypothetical protein